MSMPAAQPDLRNHVVVITGATGAIGRATAALFRRHGATVAAIGRDPQRLRDLDAHGAHTWRIDLRDPDALRDLAGQVEGRLGPANSLLTFAGGNGFPVPMAEETLDHWREVLEGDLTATFATVQAFLPQLISHPDSSIVTMSSSAGVRAGGSNAAYAAAKAGVIGLTRHLAREFLPDGVRVNCIAPGAVDNDRLAKLPVARREAMTSQLPMKRLGEPQDVANAALYLATAQSAYTTGVVLELGAPTL